MPQAPGVGALPWATGTDAQGLLTWGPGDRTDWGLFAVFCEPLEHHFLVFLHPLDVGFGLLQGLLQGPGGRAESYVLVVVPELLQLPGKRKILAPG